MARKRRKQSKSLPAAPSTLPPRVNPFRDARSALKGLVAANAAGEATPAEASEPSSKATSAPATPALHLSEEDQFAMAIGSVAPLPVERSDRVRPQRPWDERPQPRRQDEEAEFAAEMHEQDSAEWHASDVSEVEIDDLRRGVVDVDKSLDLHGSRAETARRAVAACLHEARARRYACVLIIHGKGQRSGSEGDVLRRGVRTWLRKPPLRDAVRAFTSALPNEGGSGATRVLIRPL